MSGWDQTEFLACQPWPRHHIAFFKRFRQYGPGPPLALPYVGPRRYVRTTVVPTLPRRGFALMLMASHRSVVWNYRLDGLTARAVIDRGESTVKLSLFLDDELQDIEEFSNSRDAMKRAEELRLLLTHRGRRARRAS